MDYSIFNNMENHRILQNFTQKHFLLNQTKLVERLENAFSDEINKENNQINHSEEIEKLEGIIELFESKVEDLEERRKDQKLSKAFKKLKDFIIKKEEEKEALESENGDFKDVFEWWLVSDFLMDKLKEKNQIYITFEDDIWYGRQQTGQVMYSDSIIKEIAYELGIFYGQERYGEY